MNVDNDLLYVAKVWMSGTSLLFNVLVFISRLKKLLKLLDPHKSGLSISRPPLNVAGKSYG